MLKKFHVTLQIGDAVLEGDIELNAGSSALSAASIKASITPTKEDMLDKSCDTAYSKNLPRVAREVTPVEKLALDRKRKQSVETGFDEAGTRSGGQRCLLTGQQKKAKVKKEPETVPIPVDNTLNGHTPVLASEVMPGGTYYTEKGRAVKIIEVDYARKGVVYKEATSKVRDPRKLPLFPLDYKIYFENPVEPKK